MSSTLNSLARASSAYLRSAMHQPIQWHEWGPEAFAAAQRENKPMLLDIGAVWCHWCHVMDRESYDDPGNRRDRQRALHRDEGRPRRASRHRQPLPGRRASRQRTGWLAAHRLSHTRRQAVLWRHIFPSQRRIRTSQLSPRAAEHRQRLQGKEWRHRRAGQDGRERNRAVRIVRGKRRPHFARADHVNRNLSPPPLRPSERRLRPGAQISAPLRTRPPDRTLRPCSDGRIRPSRRARVPNFALRNNSAL